MREKSSLQAASSCRVCGVHLSQLDEHEHSQLGSFVSMLQDCVEVDDETKSNLTDVYHNVTDLTLNRGNQLRQSLLVRDNCLFIVMCEIAEQFTCFFLPISCCQDLVLNYCSVFCYVKLCFTKCFLNRRTNDTVGRRVN